MKLISSVAFYILFLQNIFCQQNAGSDIMPLAVGNKWIYNYYRSYYSVMPHYQSSSDGIFEYKIVGKENSADSTIWHFYQKWEIHQSGYGTPLWTTIKDSSYFDIIELNNSNHQLIVSKFTENSVFLFARTEINAFKFYRYYLTTDQEKAYYSFNFANSPLLHEWSLVDRADYVCSKDTGITYTESHKNFYTGYWTQSFTLKEFRKLYQEPYLSFVDNKCIIRTPFGTPKDVAIEIRNDGIKPLLISGIIIPDSNFTILHYPTSIMPEAYNLVIIRFASDTEITANTSLVINSNSISDINSIPITGIAYGEPIITLGWVDDHIYTLNNTVAKFIFHITNTGNIDLIVDSIKIDNSAFTKKNKKLLLKPNETVIDTIYFLPVSTNYYKGTISIFNNSSENPKSFVIWGYSGQTGNANINLHNISFPKTEPGNGRDTTFVVTNIGPEPIYISSEQKMTGGISFSDDLDFDLLNPGESRTHKISFWPHSSGYLSDEFYYFFRNQYHVLVFKDTVYVDGTGYKDSNSNNPVTDYSLSQNYPNPFNLTTTIKFSIPQSQFVILKVYDTLGNELTTFVNEEKSPGNYEAKFEGSNLSSGVYLYRLQAGSFSDTKKFVLLK